MANSTVSANKKYILSHEGVIKYTTRSQGNNYYTSIIFERADGLKFNVHRKTYSFLAGHLERVNCQLNGVNLKEDEVPTMNDGDVCVVFYEVKR